MTARNLHRVPPVRALIERSQVGKDVLGRESWEPGVIKHDQVVSAGRSGEVDQFLLEKVS